MGEYPSLVLGLLDHYSSSSASVLHVHRFRRDVKSRLRGFSWGMGVYPSLGLGASHTFHGVSFITLGVMLNHPSLAALTVLHPSTEGAAERRGGLLSVGFSERHWIFPSV